MMGEGGDDTLSQIIWYRIGLIIEIKDMNYANTQCREYDKVVQKRNLNSSDKKYFKGDS